MKTKLNRVAIAVHDIQSAVKLYAELTGHRFLRAGPAVTDSSGLSVAASWEAGMEIVSPIPGRDEAPAHALRRFLETRGEGIFAVIMEVDDLDAADKLGAEKGFSVAQRIMFTDEQLKAELGGKFTRFEETVFDTTNELGFFLTYNLLERA